VIDAAYFEHISQATVPPAEKRWVMWFLGNGEAYEFLLPEFQKMAQRGGVSVVAYNSRGVSRSVGHPHCSADLVEDARLIYQHLIESMGAQPRHILFYGHSIGGAIATILRAEFSPEGPIISERSFSTLAAAAQSVSSSLIRMLTGMKTKLPLFVVEGVLNALFKGRMNAAACWRHISGPKMIIYHERDEMIPHVSASLFCELKRCNELSSTRTMCLSDPVKQFSAHNSPISVS
jgi:hypothetical protein